MDGDKKADKLTFAPLMLGKQLRLVNPSGDIGVLTLWTSKDQVLRDLQAARADSPNGAAARIAVIGNFYGGGIAELLCNLQYNPQIRFLFAIGNNLNPSSVETLQKILSNGVRYHDGGQAETLVVNGCETPLPFIENLDVSGEYRWPDFLHIDRASMDETYKALHAAVETAPRGNAAGARRMKRREARLPCKVGAAQLRTSSTEVMHCVVAKGCAEAWEHLVAKTLQFGEEIDTVHGPRLELRNVHFSISAPHEGQLADFEEYGFDQESTSAYVDSAFSGAVPRSTDYSYGNRLNGFFCRNGVEASKLDVICEKLRKNKTTRAAFLSLWDSRRDTFSDVDGEINARSTPCFVSINFIAEDGCLDCFTLFRTQDLLSAWTPNTFLTVALAEHVARSCRLRLRMLNGTVYALRLDPRNDRMRYLDVIRKRTKPYFTFDRLRRKFDFREDPLGYFVLDRDMEKKEVIASYYFRGALKKTYRARTASRLHKQIVRDNCLSSVDHAMWLGRAIETEFQKLHCSSAAVETSGENLHDEARADAPPGPSRK